MKKLRTNCSVPYNKRDGTFVKIIDYIICITNSKINDLKKN